MKKNKTSLTRNEKGKIHTVKIEPVEVKFLGEMIVMKRVARSSTSSLCCYTKRIKGLGDLHLHVRIGKSTKYQKFGNWAATVYLNGTGVGGGGYVRSAQGAVRKVQDALYKLHGKLDDALPE